MIFNLILHRGLATTSVALALGASPLLVGRVTAKPDTKPRVLFSFGSRKIIAIDAVTKKLKFKGDDGKPGRTQSKLLNEILQQNTFEVSVTPRTELGIKKLSWTPAQQLKAGDHVWYLRKGKHPVTYMERAIVTKAKPLTLKIDGQMFHATGQYAIKDFGYLHVPEQGSPRTLVVTDPSHIEFRRLPLLKFSDFAVGQTVTVRMIVHPHGKLEADQIYLDELTLI